MKSVYMKIFRHTSHSAIGNRQKISRKTYTKKDLLARISPILIYKILETELPYFEGWKAYSMRCISTSSKVD